MKWTYKNFYFTITKLTTIIQITRFMKVKNKLNTIDYYEL